MNLFFWLYRINLLILLFWGAHAWPLWFLDDADQLSSIRVGYTLFTLFISIVYYVKFVKQGSIKARSIIIMIILFFAFFHMYKGIWSILMFLLYTPLFVLSEDNNNAVGHMNFITSILCVILVPGIIIHVIGLVGNLPPSLIIHHSFSDNYLFFNYFFDIVNISDGISVRFNSIFLEPAYLAAICVGSLYSYQFNFKDKRSWILIFSLFLSFSTLGYISFITSLLYYKFFLEKGINKIIPLISISLIVLIGYEFAINYNDGDNPINKRIIERMQIKKGDDISDYRSGEVVKVLYDNMVSTGEIITGVGFSNIGDYFAGGKTNGNAGYKYFMVVHGLYSTLLFFIIYLLLAPFSMPRKLRMYGWGSVIIACMVFFSIGEPSVWYVLIPMVLGVNSYNINHNHTRRNEYRDLNVPLCT